MPSDIDTVIAAIETQMKDLKARYLVALEFRDEAARLAAARTTQQRPSGGLTPGGSCREAGIAQPAAPRPTKRAKRTAKEVARITRDRSWEKPTLEFVMNRVHRTTPRVVARKFGISRSAAQWRLGRLVAAGKIRRVIKGRYTKP